MKKIDNEAPFSSAGGKICRSAVRENAMEDNTDTDWMSGLGASNTTGDSIRQQADPFAPQAVDPFARHTPPPSISAPAGQAVDPFADLLQLSVSREPPRAAGSATAITTTSAAGASASQPTVSSVPMGSVTTDARVDLGAMDPLAAPHEGSLAARRRKSEESRQKRDEFLNQMSSFLQGIETNADVVPPEPPSSLVSMGMGVGSNSTGVAASSSLAPAAPETDLLSGSGGGEDLVGGLPLWPTVRRAGRKGASSSLMMESASDDIFGVNGGGAAPAESVKRGTGDLKKILGGNSDPHPRGSLFDDIDDAPDEIVAPAPSPKMPLTSRTLIDAHYLEPTPERVAPSPVHSSSRFHDARSAPSKQAQSKAKPKSSRGLDLEEVRRRTSLLSGGGRTSSPAGSGAGGLAATERRSAAHRSSETSSHVSDMRWSRQHESQRSSFSSGVGVGHHLAAQHPLHSEPPPDPLFAGVVDGSGRGGDVFGSTGSYDRRGNYFNEDLLLARAKGNRSASGGEGGSIGFDPLQAAGERRGGQEGGQNAWGGDALRDTAGTFLTSARDGAKTFFQDAKTGVGAMGASIGGWQKQQQDGRDATFSRYAASTPTKEREPRREQSDRTEEYEVTFGDGRFGFTLAREESGANKGKGVVSKVHSHTTAQTLGVKVGDIVTGVNKRRYDTYDGVMDVLPKLPRPVLVSFKRGEPSWGTAGGERLTSTSRGASTTPSQQADPSGQGGNPLEWFAKLNPFDRSRREEGEAARRKHLAGAGGNDSSPKSMSGEVIAKGIEGGIFSWSYYGTSDGVEPNTRDAYTEHVMRCQWGPTADSMKSWMVARRYREFDALDMDLRDAYPDRRDAMPRLPPKEFFKMAPDVVERRAKGLETYMATIIHRFPDMLECSHLDRFLTISERVSTMEAAPTATRNGSTSHRRTLGTHGSSANVFAAEPSAARHMGNETSSSSGLVGTDFILNIMTSEEAYRLAQEKRPAPVEISVAEDLIAELEAHLSSLSPSAHLLSDTKLYDLVDRAQQCWPRIKAAAAVAVAGEPPSGSGHGRGSSEGFSEMLLPRVLQCDEGMEHALGHLRACLVSRGYIHSA